MLARFPPEQKAKPASTPPDVPSTDSSR